jgi:hypothetical protein
VNGLNGLPVILPRVMHISTVKTDMITVLLLSNRKPKTTTRIELWQQESPARVKKDKKV